MRAYQLAPRAEEVARRYEGGLSLRDVAGEFGCSFQAVHQLLQSRGIPLRARGTMTKPPKPRRLERHWPEIVAAYEGGQSSTAIAVAYDATGAGIRELLCRHGVAMRKHHLTPRLTLDVHWRAIADAYLAGGRVPDLAAAFGGSVQGIYHLLCRHGIPRRSKGWRASRRAPAIPAAAETEAGL